MEGTINSLYEAQNDSPPQAFETEKKLKPVLKTTENLTTAADIKTPIAEPDENTREEAEKNIVEEVRNEYTITEKEINEKFITELMTLCKNPKFYRRFYDYYLNRDEKGKETWKRGKFQPQLLSVLFRKLFNPQTIVDPRARVLGEIFWCGCGSASDV